MTVRFAAPFALTAVAAITLAGCARNGDIDESGGIAITRSACPAVAIPTETGDVTLFNPPASRTASAIDVTAVVTNLRTTCDDQGTDVVSDTNFDVFARRVDPHGARTVEFPYFSTVVRGGTTIVAKKVSTVRIAFADGQYRTSGRGEAGAVIARAEATLPQDIQDLLTRRRKAGELDAATDPLSKPNVKAAVARASFEVLIGFQLTPEQLQYNATR